MGFVPDQLNATLWDELEPLYEDLVGRSLDNIKQLENIVGKMIKKTRNLLKRQRKLLTKYFYAG